MVRNFDWASTALGPIDAWPYSLKTATALIMHSPVPIVMLWGEDGYMIYNDAYSVFAGGRHPSALGSKVREAWPEVASFNDNVMKVVLGGGTLAYKDQELTLLRNGAPEQVWMNLDYSPIFDESGKPGGVIAIVVETTERVLADRRQAFRVELNDRLIRSVDSRTGPAQAAELLGKHLGANRVGFGEILPDDKSVQLNTYFADGVKPLRGVFALSGFGEVSIARQRLGETVVVNDVTRDPTHNPNIWAAIETRSFISAPLIREGRFRASLFVNTREPREWSAQEIELVQDVAARTWDAVERARAEEQLREASNMLESQVAQRTQELRESQAMLRAIFETSFGFQALLGLDGVILDANATSLEGIGSTLQAVTGKPFWDSPWFAATPGMPQTIRDAIARAAGGEVVRDEVFVNLPVGGWRWFDFVMRPIRGEAGKVIAIVPEAVETTARRQTEEALRQSRKLEAMGQLTGGIAHDFNNLLTPILGVLDRLHRQGYGNEREQLLIEGGMQSAERAKALVQRLLAFASRQPLQPQPVHVAGLISGLSELIASTLGPRIELQIDLAGGLLHAVAEANQLEMALLNLAVNARDAMPDGGVLTIAARVETIKAGHPARMSPGRYVRISVADTGVGMDEATVERAVEPFFSTKGVGKGTGLGLSMVHGLAMQLGGGLHISSKIGAGTCVAFWLPVSDIQADAGRAACANAIPLTDRAGVALLVDDEKLVRASIADMLSDFGYRVVETGSAEEALAIYTNGGPNGAIDLVVTDHLMPGMTGTDLAHAIHAIKPELPVLIISGYAELGGIAPDLPRLAKPFRSSELSAMLENLTSRDAR